MRRLLTLVLLLAAGMLSLPVAAAFFDGEGSENWILPVQLGAMALIGAGAVVAVPELARDGASTGRRAVTGATLGVVMAVVGVVVFFLLLNGFDGA
jgi:hypothetical protein